VAPEQGGEARDFEMPNYLYRASRSAAVFMMAAACISGALAAPASEEPRKIQSTRYGDWFYRCTESSAASADAKPQCEVMQVAQVQQAKTIVNILTLAIAQTPAGSSRQHKRGDLLLTALVPLNVSLPLGLALSIDNRNRLQMPYRNCNQAGCFAQRKLDQKTLKFLGGATAGSAHLQLINGQNISLKFSLKGLTKALAELQKPSRS
jgi:invasion protein IalB